MKIKNVFLLLVFLFVFQGNAKSECAIVSKIKEYSNKFIFRPEYASFSKTGDEWTHMFERSKRRESLKANVACEASKCVK